MKQLFKLAAFLLIATFAITLNSCKKKTDEDICKTCRAFGVDGQVGEDEVCSDSEEAAFRAKYPGKEISCQ